MVFLSTPAWKPSRTGVLVVSHSSSSLGMHAWHPSRFCCNAPHWSSPCTTGMSMPLNTSRTWTQMRAPPHLVKPWCASGVVRMIILERLLSISQLNQRSSRSLPGWPEFGQHRPTLVRPKFALANAILADEGQHRANRHRAKTGRVRADVGRFWANFGTCAKCGRRRTDSGRFRGNCVGRR